ncbi:MAG TPA: hypothetical protein DCM08_13040, partial [Microscillaceae bacterium]|nr:hypothetical protein [Microscillaceae bacterium]
MEAKFNANKNHCSAILMCLLLCYLCSVHRAVCQPMLSAPVYQKDSTGKAFLQAVQRYLWTHYEPLLISKCLHTRFFIDFEFDSTKTIANFAYPDPPIDTDFDMAIIEAAKTAIRSTQAGWDVTEEVAIGTKISIWFQVDLTVHCPTDIA